jgi:predicted dienelactone hydrolase
MLFTILFALSTVPVQQVDVVWHDARRDRDVPARIYLPVGAPSPSPVIVFSHGLGNSSEGYAYLGRHWASRGYISVHPDHAGVDRDVERHGLLHLYKAGFDKGNWRLVAEDLHFVIDALSAEPALRGRADLSRIGVAGHSLGAYAALAIGGMDVDGTSYRDPRVRAAIPMSMSESFPPAAYRSVAIPMLHLTGTRDSSIVYGTTPSARRVPFESIPRDDQILVTIRGANHSTFSDDESPSNRAMHDVIRTATTSFWDATLRGGDAFALRHPLARVERSDGAPRIGTIAVRTTPLFDAGESERGAFYRGANGLQMTTTEREIRKFLLFREGDRYDAAKLTESERNLRALDFLKSVTITAGAPHDGVVDVTVTTQDAWTTDVNADFSNDGGRALYDVDVTQKNLFGGGEVAVRSANGRERRSDSIELLHPALFGPYWNVDALLSHNSDGNEQKLAIERPLFSYAARWTGSASVDHLTQDARIYDGGSIASLFRQRHQELTFTSGLAIGAAPGTSTRVLGGFDFVSDDFTPLHGLAPGQRHFHFFDAGVDHTRFRFVTLDHVDLGLRAQDFNLGAHASFDVGVSPNHVWRARSDNSWGRLFTPRAFVLSRLTATTRGGATNRDAIVSSDTRFVARFGSDYPQATVARLRVDYGRELDRDVQFFADGTNGLRAYPNFAFEGSRRTIVNVEHRVYLGREWLQLFEPGLAVFADAGRIMGPWKRDAGFGLRLGVARFESTMLRLDVAWGQRGRVILFATSQAF